MQSEYDLIAGTIEDLQESLKMLREHRAELDREIAAREGRLSTWEKKLKDLEPTGKSGPGRRPKGANLRAVAGYLSSRIEGAAPAQIREGTGLPWSSVQSVLTKNADAFEEVDGLWRLKPQMARKLGVGVPTNGANEEMQH